MRERERKKERMLKNREKNCEKTNEIERGRKS